MRIFSFKRGVEVIENWIFWIFFAIAVAVVGMIIVKIANLSIEEASKIPKDMEDEFILASRFYNSENCFAYQDEVGRVHTRVIDINKFTQEQMGKCFPESGAKYAYSLILSKSLPQGVFGPPIPIGPINTYNYPAEGYANKEIVEDVLIFYDSEYKGELRIRIKNVE